MLLKVPSTSSSGWDTGGSSTSIVSALAASFLRTLRPEVVCSVKANINFLGIFLGIEFITQGAIKSLFLKYF